MLDGNIVLVYNEEIVSEYQEVLHRDKFGFSEIALYFLQTLILIVLMLVISFIVKGIAKRDHISD